MLTPMVLIAVVVALLAPAGMSQERGITATEIVLGTTMPTSGPAAFWGVPISGAMDAWFKYLNDQGGINGEAAPGHQDDGYLPPRAFPTHVNWLNGTAFALASSLGTAVFAARIWSVAVPDRAARRRGHLGGIQNRSTSSRPATSKKAPCWSIHGANLKAKERRRILSKRPLRPAGLLGSSGASPMRRETGHGGLVWGDRRSAQAQKMKESGADAVILYATPRAGALIVRDMAKLGYKPTLLSSFTLADPAMFALAGDAWNNVHLGAYFPLPGLDPKVDAVLATLSRINPALARSPFNAVAGVGFIEAFLEGVRRAGPNLTKDRVVQAMESMKNWDGEVMRAVSFGPDRHQGTNRLFMIKAEAGKFTKLTDWYSYPTKF
jgi:branched-chain amino acid transport system substrate-binding protein